MIVFKTPSLVDCENLLCNLRPADREEIEAGGQCTAQEMMDCLGNEDSFSVFNEGGDLICIYGVYPHPKDPLVGIVWLLGTPLLDQYLFVLCKRAPAVIEGWLKKFNVLSNITDKRNRKIILWLRWLGFKFVADVDLRGHPFVQFVKVRPCAIPSASR